MNKPMQIVNRTASDCFFAWCWADAAASLGWRVIAVFKGDAGCAWCVWAETEEGIDPNIWDAKYEETQNG